MTADSPELTNDDVISGRDVGLDGRDGLRRVDDSPTQAERDASLRIRNAGAYIPHELLDQMQTRTEELEGALRDIANIAALLGSGIPANVNWLKELGYIEELATSALLSKITEGSD